MGKANEQDPSFSTALLSGSSLLLSRGRPGAVCQTPPWGQEPASGIQVAQSHLPELRRTAADGRTRAVVECWTSNSAIVLLATGNGGFMFSVTPAAAQAQKAGQVGPRAFAE